MNLDHKCETSRHKWYRAKCELWHIKWIVVYWWSSLHQNVLITFIPNFSLGHFHSVGAEPGGITWSTLLCYSCGWLRGALLQCKSIILGMRLMTWDWLKLNSALCAIVAIQVQGLIFSLSRKFVESKILLSLLWWLKVWWFVKSGARNLGSDLCVREIWTH